MALINYPECGFPALPEGQRAELFDWNDCHIENNHFEKDNAREIESEAHQSAWNFGLPVMNGQPYFWII